MSYEIDVAVLVNVAEDVSVAVEFASVVVSPGFVTVKLLVYVVAFAQGGGVWQIVVVVFV